MDARDKDLLKKLEGQAQTAGYVERIKEDPLTFLEV